MPFHPIIDFHVPQKKGVNCPFQTTPGPSIRHCCLPLHPIMGLIVSNHNDFFFRVYWPFLITPNNEILSYPYCCLDRVISASYPVIPLQEWLTWYPNYPSYWIFFWAFSQSYHIHCCIYMYLLYPMAHDQVGINVVMPYPILILLQSKIFPMENPTMGTEFPKASIFPAVFLFTDVEWVSRWDVAPKDLWDVSLAPWLPAEFTTWVMNKYPRWLG